MEKRLLLAFALSFVVLFAWSALNPSAQKTELKKPEVVANKKDTVEQSLVKTPAILEDSGVSINNEEISRIFEYWRLH